MHQQAGRVLEILDPPRVQGAPEGAPLNKAKKHTHEEWLRADKNYGKRWHFASIVGTELATGLERRRIRLTPAGLEPPSGGELSARNPQVTPWLLLEKTFCMSLLKCEPEMSQREAGELEQDPRMTELVHGSEIHKRLVEETRKMIRKRLGNEEINKLKEADRYSMKQNNLEARILDSKSKSSPKELYRMLCLHTYKKAQVSAVNKVQAARCVQEGTITLSRLREAMARNEKVPAVNRAQRTSAEFILGAVRTAKHLKHLPEIGTSRPCVYCQIYERGNRFSGINHFLQQCGVARFTISRIRDMVMVATGVRIAFTLDQLILLELTESVRKKLKTKENIKLVFAFCQVIKSVLFSAYYKRQSALSQTSLTLQIRSEIGSLQALLEERGMQHLTKGVPQLAEWARYKTSLKWHIIKAKKDLVDEGAPLENEAEEGEREEDEEDDPEQAQETAMRPEEQDAQTPNIRSFYTQTRRGVAVEQLLHSRNLLEGRGDREADLISQRRD